MGQGHSLPRTVEGEDIRSNVTCTVLLRISEVASHFTPICGASSRAKRCCLPWRDTHTHSHRHTHRTGPAKDTNRLLPPPSSAVKRRTRTHAHASKWLFHIQCKNDSFSMPVSLMVLFCLSHTPALSLLRGDSHSSGAMNFQSGEYKVTDNKSIRSRMNTQLCLRVKCK